MLSTFAPSSAWPSTSNTSRFWRATALGLVICCILLEQSSSFTMEMTYKPPVKSSVKKLHERRFPSTSSSTDVPAGGGISRSPLSSSQKSAHAGAFAPPQGASSFEQRMRNLLQRPESRTTTATTTSNRGRVAKSLPSNVVSVGSLRDYKTVVGEESSRLVVVRFHATYCRACIAVAPHFYKLAKLNPNVLFVEVPVTETTVALHQGLGVPSLPYAHIYHPQEGLIEEMKLTRKEFSRFRETLKAHMDEHGEMAAQNSLDGETS